MELRARTRPMLRRAGLTAALSALLVPAVAGTATAEAKAPVVKRVTPKRVFVGETLTVRGRHFRTGIARNTVAFKRKGAKVVLVRSDKSTKKMLKVELPKRLERILPIANGTPVAARLRVRVMSTRFGRRYTSLADSPIVGPEKPPAPPKPPTADPNADCDGDGAVNRADADDDNDLLADVQEASLNKLLDPCKSDTDGDGAEDGYEYQSARDLNDDEHQRNPNRYAPYPRTLPYPNPLDGLDGDADHDGDRLTLVQEFKLWVYTIGKGAPRALGQLSYSAGEQYSVSQRAGGTGRRTPTLNAADYDKQAQFLSWASANGYATVDLVDISDPTWWDGAQPYSILNMDRIGAAPNAAETEYYDFFDNGKLDDAERDEDADGLTNWAETSGCMQPNYWVALYKKESRYPVSYAGTAHDDPDSDGDGVRDGADDQDHDDLPNVMECSRTLASGVMGWDALDANAPAADGRNREGWVNPFNPCLPYTASRTCSRIVTVGDGWAPFNTKSADIYFIHN